MSTLNQNLRARAYTKEYLESFDTVFGEKRAFDQAFQRLQILDGIRSNATAFTVKTNNTPVVLNTYNKGANVGFGSGTGNTSRFGPRTEIIYTDTDVPYDYELSIHEGIDITTVNADVADVVLDRLYLQSEKQTKDISQKHGAFLANLAGNEEDLVSFGADDVLKLFNDVVVHQTNIEVAVPTTAYVNPDLYNAIVDHPLVNGGKGSAVNIDANQILYFKDFRIEKTPQAYFPEGVVALFVPDGSAIPFVGIEMARTIESEDFAGVALQALAKGGSFMLDDNKIAVTKVTAEAISG